MLALLYILIVFTIRISKTSWIIMDYFALTNQLPWILDKGPWVALLLPVITLIIFLIFGAIIYIKGINVTGVIMRNMYLVLAMVLVTCIAINLNIYKTEKPFRYALQNMASTITLKELERLPTDIPDCNIFITREDCPACNTVKYDLYKYTYETGMKIWRYDTTEDREKRAEQLNKILNDYKVDAVPTLLIFKNGVVLYRFTGIGILQELENHMSEIVTLQ